jgi:hypothetical protein
MPHLKNSSVHALSTPSCYGFYCGLLYLFYLVFDRSNSVFKLWKEFDDFLNGHNLNQHPVVMLNFETP